MNDRDALQRLWWKEFWQLAPIVIMLPLLGLLLLLLFELRVDEGLASGQLAPILVVVLGMPGLFAVGAGALLVGHEKELRTIQWLSSLPIAPGRIVRVKLGAALTGLLLLWCLSGLLVAATAASEILYMPANVPWANWFLNSMYVLLAGFALAWALRSALIAMLWVVPVATAPFLLAYGIDSIAPWQGSLHEKPSPVTLMVCQGLGIAVALWLTDQIGRRALAAQSPRPERTLVRAGLLERYRGQAERAGYAGLQAPLPALLWQFARQSRGLLVGTSLLLLPVVVIAAAGPSSPRFEAPGALALLLMFLATTWLGASVFQSDTVGNRIRFLADRGVSPRLVWCTRQAVPASVLAAFILLCVFCLGVIGSWNHHEPWDRKSLSYVLTAIGFGALVFAWIYAVAQWSGQFFFSPIITAVVSPFIVLAALSYGGFVIQSLGVPWWLPALLVLIPPTATLTLTRRWMDRRFDIGYWASHAGFLGAALFIPWIPLLATVARAPTMPTAVARELRQARESSTYFRVTPQELVFGVPELPAGSLQAIQSRWDRQLEDLERQLSESSGPISVSSVHVLEQVRGIATLMRMSLDDGSGATDPRRGQIYRRSVGLLMQIAQRMRLSPRIIEQDVADLIEIWLLMELRHDSARERLGEALYEAAARSLADRAGRSEARARSVALSWWQFEIDSGRRHPTNQLGGYDLLSLQATAGTIRGGLLSRRQVAPAVTDLWELAKGGEQAATAKRLERIADYWQRPLGEYGIGATGDYLRADDLDQFVHPGFRHGRRAIASQWYGLWERQAAELLSR